MQKTIINIECLVICIAVLFTACNVQPYNKRFIYTKHDDQLTIKDKVEILKESSDVDDDALQASVANLYAQNGNWEEARLSIAKAIKLNPLEPSYHLGLAHYYAELRMPEQAYAEAKIAHELKAYDPNLSELLAEMAIKTKDSIGGAAFINRYYLANSDNPKAQLLKARLSLYEHSYSESNYLVELGLQNDSTSIEGWQTAFQVNKEMRRFDKAVQSGEQLIRLDSTNVTYYLQLADLFLKADNEQKASRYFFSAYQLKPDFVPLESVVKYHVNNEQYDSVLFYTDSLIARSFYSDKYLTLQRARALDKRYKYDDSFLVYNRLWESDTTDSVVAAERTILQRKIAYLQRKKQEQKRLADSLATAMPTINF